MRKPFFRHIKPNITFNLPLTLLVTTLFQIVKTKCCFFIPLLISYRINYYYINLFILIFLFSARESREIRRECWPHAKALTCRYLYPKCTRGRNEPEVKPLCKGDCTYVKKICDGEYKRMLSSEYYQKFIPKCGDQATIFTEVPCDNLPTYKPERGRL